MYEFLLQSHRIGHLPKIDTKRKDHKCIGLCLNKGGTMFLDPTRDLIHVHVHPINKVAVVFLTNDWSCWWTGGCFYSIISCNTSSRGTSIGRSLCKKAQI